MVRPTINSEKHIVPQAEITITQNTVQNIVVVDANNALSNATQVRVGATVKAIHVELWYLGDAAQPIFQVSTLEKVVGDGTPVLSAQMSNLNDYANKKNILQTSQGLVGDSNTNPIPVFRGWIKIPKGKQRMGQGDKIYLNVAARGETNNDCLVCGMFIFKEYY